ncbi:MAG TPA: hypothetical protein VHO23_01205 [Candidatus Paceibacterota bacterium]|nr:hypothetical protein [Candidatus Paceibacterota bacterium]
MDSAATATSVQIGPAFSAASAYQVVSVAAWVIFILWALYTLIAAYHWLRYGHRSPIAIPALVAHVIVSALLALYAISGFIAT